MIDAYARGAALYDAMSVAETPGALVAADARARWDDIQRRADSLAEQLYALREAAPDEAGRMRAEDLLASLRAVRSAMDAERAPLGAGPAQAEVVRGGWPVLKPRCARSGPPAFRRRKPHPRCLTRGG